MIQVIESWSSGADDSSSCVGWLGCAPFPKSCSGAGWGGSCCWADAQVTLVHAPFPACCNVWVELEGWGCKNRAFHHTQGAARCHLQGLNFPGDVDVQQRVGVRRLWEVEEDGVGIMSFESELF